MILLQTVFYCILNVHWRPKAKVLKLNRPFCLVQQRPKSKVKKAGDLLQRLQIDFKNRDVFLSTREKHAHRAIIYLTEKRTRI